MFYSTLTHNLNDDRLLTLEVADFLFFSLPSSPPPLSLDLFVVHLIYSIKSIYFAD